MSDQTSGVPGARAGAEAARLVSAAQEWLRTSAPHLAPLDADGQPCSCPLCRGVAAVREADPDQVGRWVDSAVAALEGVLAQATSRAPAPDAAADETAGAEPAPADPSAGAAEDGEQDGPRPRRVRRIPLDPASEQA